MKKIFLSLTLLFIIPLSVLASNLDTAKAIQQNLNAQVTTWNRGDMDAFMKFYKNSNSTLYIANPIIRGYDFHIVDESN